MPTTNITALVEEFSKAIVAAAKASVTTRIQAALAAAFGAPKKRGPGRPRKAVAPVAGKKSAGKRTRKVTPKVARARKLQGQYLGALRALSAEDRAKVKAVAKEKGVAAAVKMAAGMKKA